MSQEELPISGDRWSELRKGGVYFIVCVYEQITNLDRYSNKLNQIVQLVRMKSDNQQMTNETERPSATDLISLIPEMYKTQLQSIRAYVRNVIDC